MTLKKELANLPKENRQRANKHHQKRSPDTNDFQLKINSVYDDLTKNEVSQNEPLERLNSSSIDSIDNTNTQNKL